MLHKCVFFQRQVQGVPLETSRAVVWARRLWYSSWDSDLGRLSSDDFSRIMLILSDLFRNSEKAYQKFCSIVALPNFDFCHLLADDDPDFASFSDDQSGTQTERNWVCDGSQAGGSSVRSDAPDFNDFGDDQFLRLRIIALPATVQQPAAAVKTFAPVVENKEVELKFTISLHQATLSFDGCKRPRDTSADWKPRHAIASWASWSRDAKTEKVITSPNASFCCKEAANVTLSIGGAAASDLLVEWRDFTASTADITKKLKQKPGAFAFEEKFVQITVFAANRRRMPPTQACDETSRPIVLGVPFVINLSVRRLNFAPVFSLCVLVL